MGTTPSRAENRCINIDSDEVDDDDDDDDDDIDDDDNYFQRADGNRWAVQDNMVTTQLSSNTTLTTTTTTTTSKVVAASVANTNKKRRKRRVAKNISPTTSTSPSITPSATPSNSNVPKTVRRNSKARRSVLTRRKRKPAVSPSTSSSSTSKKLNRVVTPCKPDATSKTQSNNSNRKGKNGDDKKPPARQSGSNQSSSTDPKINLQREDEETLRKENRASHVGAATLPDTISSTGHRANKKKWDKEDLEPLVKQHNDADETPEKLSNGTQEHKMEQEKQCGHQRNRSVKREQEDEKKGDNGRDCSRQQSHADSKVQPSVSGETVRHNSRVGALKWCQEDEEPLAKVLSKDDKVKRRNRRAAAAATSYVYDADSDEWDDEECSSSEDDEPVRKRRRTGNRQANNIMNQQAASVTQRQEHSALEEDEEGTKDSQSSRAVEDDDRCRTSWTPERDEMLWKAVAMQSLNDVTDWEEIRRAVGATTVCSTQHRWFRVKHKQPSPALLKTLKEHNIPWPIDITSRWTKPEIKKLFKLAESFAHLGYDERWDAVGRQMGRTKNAVQAKYSRVSRQLENSKRVRVKRR